MPHWHPFQKVSPMVEDEVDDEPTQPHEGWRDSRPRLLYHALFDLQTQCYELAAALADGRPVDIEAAASELAAAWFEATEAIKATHIAADDPREAEHTGMLALRATHQVLFDLFVLAPPLPAAELPKLQAVLCRLSARIGHSLAALAEECVSPKPTQSKP